MFRCTDTCDLDWDKLAKFMVEIWTGRDFSFLRESWYHADLLTVMLNLGNCGCIPFNAMQLACYAKQVDSINQLIALGCRAWKVKEEVTLENSHRCDRRKIREENPHPNPAYFDYLKFIVRKEYQIRTSAPECLLVKTRKDHNDSPVTIAKCLKAIFDTNYTPLCNPFRYQRCVCDTFIHSLMDNTLSGEVLLLLGKHARLWPTITIAIGYDWTESVPGIFRDLRKPQIVACIFEDKAENTISFFWAYYYAHGRYNQRILTGDSTPITNNRIKDLRKLFEENNYSNLLEFFLLATKDRRLIIGGGAVPFHVLATNKDQKMHITSGEGEELYEALQSVHTFFQPVPDLFSLCRKKINRILAYPYQTSMGSLPIPDVIKNRIRLD